MIKPEMIISPCIEHYAMDFGSFDKCFDELRTVLRDKLGNGKNTKKLDIYGSYLDYGDEIKAIVDRIETEAQKDMTLSKMVFEALRKGEEPDEQLSIESLKNLILIRLDVKSFFVFTRIFLDTLARIIMQYYDEESNRLWYSMRKLVKSQTLRKLDSNFAKGLEDRTQWMNDFVETRVEIEHYLGSIRSTTTKNGKFGFDILGLRTRHDWGTDTVGSITDYIKETLHNLSQVISYVHSKFQSKSIKA